MKKKTVIRIIALVVTALILIGILAMLAGCAPADYTENGTAEVNTGSTKKSEYAIIRLPDDTIIQGYVERKYTYSVGMVDIQIDGVEYTTHWANVVVFDK